MTTETRDNIQTLQNLAAKHARMAFAHLCTAALNGEAWALERLMPVIAEVDAIDYQADAQVLAVIDRVDTSWPNGAVARGGVQQPEWLRKKLGLS